MIRKEQKTKYCIPTKCQWPPLNENCGKTVIYQVHPESTCGVLYVCTEHLSHAVDKCLEWDAQVVPAGNEAATVTKQ